MIKNVLVLPLAGMGSRFVEQGFRIPKFLLPIPSNHALILSRIIAEFKLTEGWHVVIVLRNEHRMYTDIIQEICLSACVSYEINYVDYLTRGQAETVYLSIGKIAKSARLWIHNGDTILLNRNLDMKDLDCIVDVFDSNSKNYSYITSDGRGRVKSIVEKQVVSNLASSGLYGFASVATYIDYYKLTDWDQVNNEYYVSFVISTMLNMEKAVGATLHSNEEMIVLGTPEDYLEHINHE